MTSVDAPRGRPRSVEADAAILDAATELFCELGYDALSVEGVAARAGVGKTTIYRRYPTKVDLVMAASAHMSDGLVAPVASGDLRTDLLAVAGSYLRMLTDSAIGRAIPMMIVAKSHNPELARAHDRFVADRRAGMADVLRPAIGASGPGFAADAELMTDLVTGPIFLRVFVTGQPVTSAYLGSLVDRIVS